MLGKGGAGEGWCWRRVVLGKGGAGGRWCWRAVVLGKGGEDEVNRSSEK